MKFNRSQVKKYLQLADFTSLFIEELGWDYAEISPIYLNVNDENYTIEAICQKRGLMVYHCLPEKGILPNAQVRKKIDVEVTSYSQEHLIIYTDKGQQKQIWQWVKRESATKTKAKETTFNITQSGELLSQKLEALFIDFAEEENLTLTDVTQRTERAFDIEKVTKDFFNKFQERHFKFAAVIQGIENPKDANWYASVVLNRLMFIYFLQKKGFLDHGNPNYLQDKLKLSQTQGQDLYYQQFLQTLFFDGFGKAEKFRKQETAVLIGKIKYINGGLFLPHIIEEKYRGQIRINDAAFEDIFNLFSGYTWHLNDTPTGKDNEINPDVLGYIFEKYINQKEFGAYYTKPEITNYLCERTINKFISGKINPPQPPLAKGGSEEEGGKAPFYKGGSEEEGGKATLIISGKINPPQPPLAKGGSDEEKAPFYKEGSEEEGGKAPFYKGGSDEEKAPLYKGGSDEEKAPLYKGGSDEEKAPLYKGGWGGKNLNNQLCQQLLDEILPQLSILDPACGSGAFLVAALQHLIKIYTAIFDFIQVSGNAENQARLRKIKQDHPSLDYYIKKRVITDNLYGVDIMEEAVEIAKLRLFLSLVASAETVDDLEPLPNVDFNIMSGNSLIGLIRVDDQRFDYMGETKQGNILQSLNSQNYQGILKEKNESISKYKEHAFIIGEVEGTDQEDRLGRLKRNINDVNRESLVKLNQLLLDEFGNLKIKYEEVQLKGKPVKRVLNIADMEALKPFHWGYHFDQIIAKGGFDIILGNPPWEVFQTDEKEFFQQYCKSIQKNKLRIEDWDKQREILLEDPIIQEEWLEYSSKFPHQWTYFKKAECYKNQITIYNGKTVGNKPNLYSLFLEQCCNLLSKNGECGLVIPSGIYTDLGTKQLREMLFSQTKITGLFCFENRKAIFEGVDSRFKFVVLTFENGNKTLSFPARFMRHDVGELNSFPDDDCIHISVDLIKRLSPDSLSIIEFNSQIDLAINNKLIQFPLLSDIYQGWGLELYGEELNMTRSKTYFKNITTQYPVYEGKMIWHFDHNFAQPRYWIKESELRQEFLEKRCKRINDLKQMPDNLKNDYEVYRLAIRKIARNTDTRTLISTIIPPFVFCGNSLSVHFPFVNSKIKYNNLKFTDKDLLILTTLLNSFVIDYILRLRMTANLNLFYVYQLPVPRLTEKDAYFQEIVERAAKLICTTAEYDELAREVGLTSHENGITDERERGKIRAELDGIIAHLYGLTETEFSHILSTFPIVAEEVKTAALNAYREMVK